MVWEGSGGAREGGGSGDRIAASAGGRKKRGGRRKDRKKTATTTITTPSTRNSEPTSKIRGATPIRYRARTRGNLEIAYINVDRSDPMTHAALEACKHLEVIWIGETRVWAAKYNNRP